MLSNLICTCGATVTNLLGLRNKLSHWNMHNLLFDFSITLAAVSPKEKHRGFTSLLTSTPNTSDRLSSMCRHMFWIHTCLHYLRQTNSDQSPSHARCSASWHKLLSSSLGKRPHSSTTASDTMTQTLQFFKFALWSLAVGISKWNRQGARSVRQALHIFTVSSRSQGCPPNHHFACAEHWHTAAYGEKQL